jgi:Cu-processing system permease protein
MSTFTIARLTFKEAASRRILLAALVLGLIFLAIYGFGFRFIIGEITREEGGELGRVEFFEVANFLMLAGLYVVNFMTVMMTVLTSVDTLSGEINSGSIHTVVSKPIRRWEVVLGKWLGFSGMLTLYLLLMAGGVLLLVYTFGQGYVPPNPLRALALLWLNSMLLLTVSLLGGTVLSTLANGVVVFGLFGIAFIGGWIEQIGTFWDEASATQAAINIGIITSLILPSEALWKRAAFEVQSPFMALMGATPFSARSVPSTLMIAYAVLYVLMGIALAIRLFNRRDL